MKFLKSMQSNLSKKMKWFEEKYPKTRGRGSERSEKTIFNHPRRDSQVRSGKK